MNRLNSSTSISITLDMDWAADEVIDYSLSLLEKYRIKSTLFMTNKTHVKISSSHEIGIHPNFKSMDFETHIKECISDFPTACGIRSHTLFFTERFRVLYKKYGLKYQSNVMMYRQPGIEPYWMSRSTLEVPLYWMDVFYIEMEDQPTFTLEDIDLKTPGLKVFNFHPIHIFLNTNSLKVYKQAKKYQKNPKHLMKFRNTQIPGIENLFIELLEYIKFNKIEPMTLLAISDKYDGSL